MKESGYAKETVFKWNKVVKTVSEARKLMRIGRPLEYVQGLLQSLSVKDDFLRVVNIIKNAALALWLWYDMFEWLQLVGLYHPADLKALKRKTAWYWFVGLFFSIIANVMKLRETLSKIDKASSTSIDSAKKELSDLKKTQQKNLLDLVKNSVDILLPAVRLELLSLNDGVVGLAGATTSLIGGYDQWNKVSGGKS